MVIDVETHRESLFQVLFEEAPDGILIVGTTGAIELANAEIEALFGYTREELLGQPVELLMPERLRNIHQHERAQYAERPRRRPMGAGLDLWGRRKDGTEFPVEMSLSPLSNRGERFVIASIRDVTDKRRAEEERADAIRLEELFVAMLGHDLRGPLSTISMASQMIPTEQDGHKRAVLARRARESARRMGRMIEQLLDLAQARTAGGIRVSRKPTDLRRICRAVVAELDVAHPDRRISFHATGDCCGSWDGDRLAQVVSNLLENALHHGADSAIELTLQRDGDEISLEVHNGGSHTIPHELLPHIFDPFRRGRQEERSPRDGLGLGLYIVHQIVSAHDGTIEVESSDVQGTRFTVRLPARESAKSEALVPIA